MPKNIIHLCLIVFGLAVAPSLSRAAPLKSEVMQYQIFDIFEIAADPFANRPASAKNMKAIAFALEVAAEADKRCFAQGIRQHKSGIASAEIVLKASGKEMVIKSLSEAIADFIFLTNSMTTNEFCDWAWKFYGTESGLRILEKM